MHKYWDVKLASVFFLGFASGLPFLMILSTLSIWLAEVGVSKTMIGLLAWVSVPYTFKFLWGRMVDNTSLPWLTKKLGLRRSWILLAQICSWIALVGLGATNPQQNLFLTACMAFVVGCCSAVQDIAIEAYRIETFPGNKVGMGASASVLGYRLGMLCAGAGTIFLAAIFNSWFVAYAGIATCMSLGIIATLTSQEPQVHRTQFKLPAWTALQSFIRRHDWQIIIPLILSYKVADTVLNVMSMPFLLEIGFTKLQIAYVAKTYGITAMIIGGFAGGVLLHKQSLRQNLLLCVILQAFASGLFVTQAYLGNNLEFLFFSLGVENFVCGMSQVSLIAYLTHLCGTHSIAWHYALLSSFASFVRVSFSALAGWLADKFAWPQFYSLVCISCIPSVLLLILCTRHFSHLESPAKLEPVLLETN